MAKLLHFSHSCPLTGSPSITDGICDSCFSDEPVEFACKACNFDLCKPCSYIPEKVSHHFHSEHPLEFNLFRYDRKPGYIICSGCGNMSSCSFYECKKCEIFLDLGCALLKNISKVWDAKEMLHYSHEHLLRRCRPGPDATGSCLLCELPVSPSSICYGCVYCYSFLHERCLDLPTEIRHPVHPKHPLRRLDFIRSGGRTSCDACGDTIDGVPLGCRECRFNIHLRCADSLLRGLLHDSHEHRLSYVASKNAQVDSGRKILCQICMRKVSSLHSYYHCIECDLKYHFECLGIPKSMFKRSCHFHPLVCKKLPEEDDSLEYCGVCETVVLAGHDVYSCEECDFHCHIECTLREVKPSPLYLKDLYSCGENLTRAANQEDGETSVSEFKVMVNDIDHNHVMTSAHRRYQEDSERHIADGERSIADSETSMADNETSIADNETSIADSETSIADSETSIADSERSVADSERSVADSERSVADSERSIADNETSIADSETSMAESETTADDVDPPLSWPSAIVPYTASYFSPLVQLHCGICRKEIQSKQWYCDTCSFVTHDICAALGNPSRHRIHWKHLLTLVPIPLARDMTSCNSCGANIEGFNLFCRICNFTVHVTCAMKGKFFQGMLGPKIVGMWRGRCLSGKHMMVQVRFSKQNEIVCDICGESMYGKGASCTECERVYHPRCFDPRYRPKAITEDNPSKNIRLESPHCRIM